MNTVRPYIDPIMELLDSLSNSVELSQTQQTRCLQLFHPRRFIKNQTLLNIGEIWQDVFFITHGAMRLFYTSEDGREFNKGFFFERQFAWPIAPIARKEPSRFTIVTMQETQVLAADLQAFKSLLKEFDGWEKFALAQAEWLAEQKVIREAEFLLDTAEQRYVRFTQDYAAYLDLIPDYHIASYLGITSVSLSRIRKKLRAC